MRTSSAAIALAALTAACAPESNTPEGVTIECAIGAGADWAQICLLETSGDGAFTIHRPDDTFQRFRYDAPLGITPLDGADEVSEVTINLPAGGSGLVEFTYRDGRYRLDPIGIAPGSDE